MNNIEQLKEYKELLDMGAITQEQFNELKAAALAAPDSIEPDKPSLASNRNNDVVRSSSDLVININKDNPIPTIDRIKLYLEDNDWGKAEDYAEAALDYFPTTSTFFMLKYCATHRLSYIEELEAQDLNSLENNSAFEKARRFSSEESWDAKAIYQRVVERTYDSIVAGETKASTNEDYLALAESMSRIKNYSPAIAKIEEYEIAGAKALMAKRKAEYENAVVREGDNPNTLKDSIIKLERLLQEFKQDQKYFSKLDPNDLGVESLTIKEIAYAINDAKDALYKMACSHQDSNERTELFQAKSTFEYLKDYEDSKQKLAEVNNTLKAAETEDRYVEATEAEKRGKYDKAITIYQSLGNYKDAEQRIKEIDDKQREKKYNDAVRDYDRGNTEAARVVFTSLGDYKKSKEYLAKMNAATKKKTKKIVAIVVAIAIVVAGVGVGFHIYKVKKAEEAARIAEQKRQEEKKEFDKKAEKMKPAIEAALLNSCTGLEVDDEITVGLKKDGTVVSTAITDEEQDYGQTKVEDWKDIIAVSAGGSHTVGLKKDGTVVSTVITDEEYDDGETKVEDWKDIIAVSGGAFNTVGLKKDGTVVSTPITTDSDIVNTGQTKVEDWKDIIAVSAGFYHTVGLKKDGTIVSTTITTKSYDDGQTKVEDWKDIIAVSAGSFHTVGLKKDGTVISTAIISDDDILNIDNGQTKVEDWKDIIAVSAGSYHTVGLKKDGTVVSTAITDEEQDYGQTKVEDWKDIIAVSAGKYHTVGLKKDGTVISTAITEYDYGQTKVKGWKNIVNKGYKLLSR